MLIGQYSRKLLPQRKTQFLAITLKGPSEANRMFSSKVKDDLLSVKMFQNMRSPQGMHDRMTARFLQ